MQPKSAEDYSELLPSQSRELPKFNAVLQTLVGAFVRQQQVVSELPTDYDLDTAMGAQLDVIGEWVGISRRFPLPITDVYMEWDGDAGLGWDGGFWKGAFDPSDGPATMNDTDYRRLLRTKILVNNWDGSFEQLLVIWNAFLPPNRPGIVLDGFDMTLSFGFEGSSVSGVDLAVLNLGLAMIKPSAVRIKDVFSATDGLPLFVWDSDGGWDTAAWSTLINT